ncbi:PucR family transcriptional regulator [Nocardia caishijiensis]|uniref:PucR-like helix-turn-helix protein n=1 Tax=Nocardia caishijiensis TaxID=184756 RepID=A0ABQ6YI39_9NOCA|nr:helix-turn-helix domain-containing protein [Nocardia caishijiensis]KAF0845255.1 PucR-like helix-turn-helix protein [Nocardia caishijiensis]
MARIPALTDRVVGEARAQMPSYAALGHPAVTATAAALIERMLAALAEERDLNDDDCRELREYGEARAQQGISLVDVQHGWRIALRDFRAALAADGRAHQVADGVLLELSHAMLDLVDQAALAYGQGHREVELEMARLDHQVRAEFVRRVLHGTLGPAGIRVQAHQFGLDIDGEYQAFRTRSRSRDADTELRQFLRSDGHRVVFTTTIDDDIAGFTSAPAELRTDAPLGLGPVGRLDDLARSFRLASRLLLTADVFDLRGPTELTGVGLLAAVVGEADIGAELVEYYVVPVGAGPAARVVIDTVERHLDTGMHIETTAELLVVHPNTVRYRISRFEELTGTDLRSPVTSARVWWAIKHLRATT